MKTNQRSPYSEPVWPKIPGIEQFKGHKTHSGRWVHDYDYSNKRIAVIGNGSSGIQIVPQMTKLPGTTVRNFIRGPAWVYYRVPASKHLGRDTDDTNPAYYESEKEKYHDPVQHREYRKGIIHRTNKAFRLVSAYAFLFNTQGPKANPYFLSSSLKVNIMPRLSVLPQPRWPRN